MVDSQAAAVSAVVEKVTTARRPDDEEVLNRYTTLGWMRSSFVKSRRQAISIDVRARGWSGTPVCDGRVLCARVVRRWRKSIHQTVDGHTRASRRSRARIKTICFAVMATDMCATRARFSMQLVAPPSQFDAARLTSTATGARWLAHLLGPPQSTEAPSAKTPRHQLILEFFKLRWRNDIVRRGTIKTLLIEQPAQPSVPLPADHLRHICRWRATLVERTRNAAEADATEMSISRRKTTR